MSIDYFDQLWQSKGPGKKSYKEGSAESWDSRVDEFSTDRPDERISKIIALLEDKHLLHHNATVLDIGCGPGRFAAEFAGKAHHVVGVDISANMLKNARQYSAGQNISNTEFIQLDWHDADLSELQWQHQFSLVTAIMSPAIFSRESLEKIIAASSENGFLCHFVEHSDPINDELKSLFFGQQHADIYGNKALYCCLNYLWLRKLYPEITYLDTQRQSTRTIEEATRHYVNRWEMKIDLSGTQREEIKDIVQRRAKDGVVSETIAARIACVYWRNKIYK
ncbi:class I SAM-dependent methyltransferase [Dehalobacter sp. DCM]|uniref:class I SAM-dependent methyltransferase n=1 Tax=Dehalobacter sp. DCM TaxID=2907827 RepID=UPI003081298B|nr:class I SAM-dependent methyltransferase [Dehalobacter sp. DCM]